MYSPQEGHCKKDVKSKVAAKTGCDGKVPPKRNITLAQLHTTKQLAKSGRGTHFNHESLHLQS